MTLTVRRVDMSEAARLTAFAAETFLNTYSTMCRPADVELYVATYLTETAMTETLRDPACEALVVEDDGAWLAYAVVRRAGLPLHVPPVTVTQPMELVRFYVTRPHHGRGVAALLFDAVQRAGARDHRDGIWLSVWQENARAIAYYQKTGFRIVGTTTFQMGDDLQDDFVMLRTASSHAKRQAKH